MILQKKAKSAFHCHTDSIFHFLSGNEKKIIIKTKKKKGKKKEKKMIKLENQNLKRKKIK